MFGECYTREFVAICVFMEGASTCKGRRGKKEAEEGELNSKHKKAFQRSMLEAQCKVK